MASKQITRRDMIKMGVAGGVLGGAVAGGGLWLPKNAFGWGGSGSWGSGGSGGTGGATTTPFQVPLPIPPVLQPTSTDATTDYYTITQKQAQVSILPGTTTTIWGYNGQFPGPTIRARSGRTVKVTQINNLSESISTHLHGAHVPGTSDGHPADLVAPGASRTYTYPNTQIATTLWYHDHAMGVTAQHVYRGLAGFYLIGDSFEDSLNLPSGAYEVPLVIQDRQFNADGSLYYPAQSSSLIKDAFTGPTVLVNGAIQPYFQVARRKYRLRFLNGSNARVYELQRSDGQPLVQIASDGGLLPAPVSRASIQMAPAERVEVVIDFSQIPLGTSIILNNMQGSGTTGQIMRFDVTGTATDTSSLPSTLRPITALAGATVTRNWDLAYDYGSGQWTINGQLYDPNRIDATVASGATEIWSFNNHSGMLHPMHMHLVQFQVLTSGGSWTTRTNYGSAAAGENGWKDTLAVDSWDSVQVIAKFSDYTGKYVLHCHKLEHEDFAMMANFTVS